MATTIVSGQTVNFQLPPTTGNVLFAGEYSHAIEVPAGATQLRIEMQANIDVDLYVRRGADVTMTGNTVGSIVADYRSESFTGTETITVVNPVAGVYYIAYSIFGGTGARAIVTMLATVTGGSTCTYSLTGGTSVSVPFSGISNGSFPLTASTGCAWTAVSDSTWLTVSTPSGTGSSTVQYQAAANAGAERTGRITAGGQVYTVTQSSSQTTALPDNALILSHIVAGGGQFNTTIFITNVSNVAEAYTLRFYADNGTPIALPLVGFGTLSVQTGTVQPGSTLRIQTVDGQTLQVGWAVLTPATPVARRLSGFAIFTQRAGTSTSEAIVNFLGPRETKSVLVYDTTAGFETGAALVNTDPSNTVAIVVTIFNETGQTIGSDTIQLPPLGHTSFAVSTRFPATSNRRGVIRFNGSPRGIAGLGLRFGAILQFTSFPMLTSPDIP